jgi:hypothetical protein
MERPGMCWGAIPVETLDRNLHDALDRGDMGWQPDGLRQRGLILGRQHARPTYDLQAPRLGMVQLQRAAAGVAVEIAHADIVPVAPEIREARPARVEHPEKAGRAAAMLDMGLAGRADRGNDKTDAVADECCLGAAKALGLAICRRLLQPGSGTRAVTGLACHDGRGEHQLGIAPSHPVLRACPARRGRSGTVRQDPLWLCGTLPLPGSSP